MSTVAEHPPLSVQARLYLGRRVPPEWRPWAMHEIKSARWGVKAALGIMPLLVFGAAALLVIDFVTRQHISAWPFVMNIPTLAIICAIRANRRIAAHAALRGGQWRSAEDRPRWYDLVAGAGIAAMIVFGVRAATR